MINEYEYLKTQKYFAQIPGTIEHHAKEELEKFGAKIIQEVPRGIRFSCDKETLYNIIYKARLIQRILAPIISFECHSEKYLYNQILNNVDWTRLFTIDEVFSIKTNVSDSKIENSLFAGQKMKDAICDQFRKKYGARPDYSNKDSDITFSLHIRKNFATISFDMTGESLHKRGYRKRTNMAPLQEILAATMVKHTKWNGQNKLMDIMCGSGTILCEALMRYCNIPAGYLREDNGMVYLPDYDDELWNKVRQKANSEIRELPKGLICGSDVSSKSLSFARDALTSLPYGDRVELRVSKFQDLPKQEDVTIICNPPYGIRMGNLERTAILYQDLGDWLKQKTSKSEAFILCGSAALVPKLRLRAHWKKSMKNGNLDTKFVKIIVH